MCWIYKTMELNLCKFFLTKIAELNKKKLIESGEKNN